MEEVEVDQQQRDAVAAEEATLVVKRSGRRRGGRHADVGEVELLPPEARRPESLDRLLDLGAEAFEYVADPRGQLREPALDLLAGAVQGRVQADAVEVARQRADVQVARRTLRVAVRIQGV